MATAKFFWMLLKSFCVYTISCAFMLKMTPVRRPFICNDIALTYPRKESTVGEASLLTYSIIFPILFIFGFETLINWKKFDDVKTVLSQSWIESSFLYGKYLIVLSLGNAFMVVVKLTTGSHRPSFFETCQPDTLKNCTLGTLVQDFRCTNPKLKGFWAEDGAMSFFSGHAQYAFYSSIFLVFYLKFRLRKSNFVVLIIQSVLISVAYFISISRVFDNRHRVIDVTVGSFVGIFQAVHAWFIQCKNFQNDENNDKEQPEILPLALRAN